MSDAQLERIEKLLLDLPDAKERRRYALLQAAATLELNGNLFHIEAVKGAESLLKEIERREA